MGLKQSRTIKERLSEAEISALCLSTKMSKSEIVKWHKGFMLDCPSGRLTKEEFVKIYEELFPSGRAKRFCESVFNVFDKNKTNTIDFSEFIMACSLTSRAKSKEKLKVLFQVYDSDSKGLLTRQEMEKIIEAVHQLYEGVPISKDDSKRKVDLIMHKFGSESGSVTNDEFIEGVANDPQLAALLKTRESNKSVKMIK